MGNTTSINGCDGDKTVFLTFDDGIHPGTQEAYNVIKAKGVKATFFLTGAHVRHAVEHSSQGALLRQDFAGDGNINLGNHSSSHANQYYEGYYEKGGVLLNDGKTRRSVLEDFKHCDATINSLLGRPNTQLKYARLPGMNTWRAVPGVPDETKGSGLFSSGPSYEEANALKDAGYKVYGWDHEWAMDFKGTNNHSDFDPEVDRVCNSGTDTVCYSEAESQKSFRFNSELDRVYTDGKAEASSVMGIFNAYIWGPRKAGKVIVLMHERAFRLYKGPNDPAVGPPANGGKFSKYLGEFIDALKANSVCFDKISNY